VRVSEGEENVRENCYPRVNISLEIPNFNSRDIYVGWELPTDVVSD